MSDQDIIIRATADNPLPDGNFAREMINIFLKNKLSYMSTHEKFFNLPYGLAIQIFRVEILRKASKKKLTKFDKEHIVPALIKEINDKEINIKLNNYKKYFSKKKFSIDTLSDYLRMEKFFRNCKNPIYLPWYKITKRNV